MNQPTEMESFEQPKSASGLLLPYGLTGALASILLYVILYLMGAESFEHPLAYLSYAIPVAVAFLACYKARQNQGYLEYSQALRLSFGIQVISFFAVSLFSYILLNYIDTAFAERMFQLTIQKTQELLERLKVPQSEIDKQIKGVLSEDIFSFRSIMQNFAISCILLFLISALIGLIMKRKQNEFPI